ncbi:MAG: trypsin-like peptidase domain-containing protein [Chloroflexi bacterium]|uniref:Trypsin-like peptidase domain-containing protein n=1 Tax=Candidatus Chlorohelix allophototropha TaxID=3003348 RepID=A0A8T7M619_9CHLR|nr:trypsin-like peptidase domain-containing protein [Chloroflexota bacterium]WJW69456.1 trypsin-like peptidase domain-containing protein [Chloroflexota bacterium L227-S17]
MNYNNEIPSQEGNESFSPYPEEYNTNEIPQPTTGIGNTSQAYYGYTQQTANWYNPTPENFQNPTAPYNRAPRKAGKVLRFVMFPALFLLALIFGMVASNMFLNVNNSSKPAGSVATINNNIPAKVVPASLSTTAAGQLTVTQNAEKNRPAVVQITTMQNASTSSRVSPFSGNSSSSPIQTGVGSGVIYDASGYILTNYHVVNGADSLLVSLPDGRSFDGTVVGKDMITDLAVVKIDAGGASLPVAELGDSSQLKVGDGVVAIGNALALPGGPTVTAGVVSALDRSVTEPSTSGGNSLRSNTASGPQLYDLIQTDAAINPGNSGGALLDMQGKVIGINTLVAGQAEAGYQAEGIGFAISINQAKLIIDQLVATGKVDHAFLGISFQPLTPAEAKKLSLATGQGGSVVMQVQSGSPAAQAGISNGDVIISIDGQKIIGESTLGEIISQHKPGDKVKLEIIGSNSQSRTVEVTLGLRNSA